MAVILVAYLAFLFCAGKFCAIRFLSEASSHTPHVVNDAVFTLFVILIPREFLETIQQILMAALKGRGETMRLLRIQGVVTCLCWLPLLFVLRAFAPSLNAYWLSTLFYMASSAVCLVYSANCRAPTRPPRAKVARGV